MVDRAQLRIDIRAVTDHYSCGIGYQRVPQRIIDIGMHTEAFPTSPARLMTMLLPGRALLLQALAAANAAGECYCADPRSHMLMFREMVLSAPLSPPIGLGNLDAKSFENWVTTTVLLFLNDRIPVTKPHPLSTPSPYIVFRSHRRI